MINRVNGAALGLAAVAFGLALVVPVWAIPIEAIACLVVGGWAIERWLLPEEDGDG